MVSWETFIMSFYSHGLSKSHENNNSLFHKLSIGLKLYFVGVKTIFPIPLPPPFLRVSPMQVVSITPN